MKLLAAVLMAVLLFANPARADEASDKILVLPLFGYSDEQGLGVGANAAWFNIDGTPWTIDTSLFASALYGQTYLNANLTDRKLFDDFYFQTGGFINRSSRALFYGVGNETSLANEAQYKIDDTFWYLRLGVRVMDATIIGGGVNHRSTGIDRGTDPLLPQFLDQFSQYPYLSGTSTTGLFLFAQYDTRNSVYAPQEGMFGSITWFQQQPRSDEVLSEQRLEITGERYDELTDKELILVSRVKYEHEWGSLVPFYLQSPVGGVDSLRAFRTNRFTDSASFLMNVEPRWTVWSSGGFFQRLELSTGLDIGRVWSSGNIPPLYGYHTDVDLGFTGLLEGDVPVRLDYAFGPEGALVYLHIFYPF